MTKKQIKREYIAWILIPIDQNSLPKKTILGKSAQGFICGSRETLKNCGDYDTALLKPAKVKVIIL